ncbi:MAG: RIP metalloprotease RseP, partial [Candidatus Sericytochromatia bacterium]|nr:RIP metalloprotease RseP [Candidatus Tanganyikabacteria bacterium]
LDGGQIAFLAAEGIARRPLPKSFKQVVNTGGMLLLLTLLVVITIKDIWAVGGALTGVR